jgi:hypothetical protein
MMLSPNTCSLKIGGWKVAWRFLQLLRYYSSLLPWILKTDPIFVALDLWFAASNPHHAEGLVNPSPSAWCESSSQAQQLTRTNQIKWVQCNKISIDPHGLPILKWYGMSSCDLWGRSKTGPRDVRVQLIERFYSMSTGCAVFFGGNIYFYLYSR